MSWDDGTHAKVNRVQLTFDDVIRSIEVEYEGTNVQPQRRGTVGTNSDEFTLSSDEFITRVSGYYRTTFSGDVITALLFRTNKKTYGPYGNLTRNFFSADAPRNNQIAGFLGNSGSALNSINVHFAPIPPPGSIKPKPAGPGTGDAGSGQPVSPGPGDAGGGPKPGGPGTGENGAGTKPSGPGTGENGAGTKPGDLGTGADGEGTKPGGSGTGEDGAGTKPGGPGTGENGAGTKPSGPGTGENGAGTKPGDLGTGADGEGTKPGGSGTDEDGAGTKPGGLETGEDGAGTKPVGSGTGNDGGGPRPVIPGKMGPLGGDKGNEFDDVGFDGVKKITVGADEFSITYIKIEYSKDGKVEIREHGTSRGQLKEFSVDYPNDNIVAVGGSYNHIFTYDTTLITSLYFTTSRGFTSPLFGEKTGTDFEFQGENRGKLLGFHGRAGFAIDAIGAYFHTGSQGGQGGGPRPVVPGKMGPLGGAKGNEFDDVGFDGVKKVTVGADEFSVTYLKIEYIKDGKVEIREHGTNRGQLKEFSVDYPNDNIVAVGGSYNHIFTYDTTLITSLYFTTSRGFTSPLFGEKKGTDFEFQGENRGKLLGFHGRAGYAIDAIGAYFHTGSQGGEGGGPKPVVPVKMGPLGGDRGNEFNDVGFDGVKKVAVAADEFSVTYIKIEYVKDGKVEIREHGTSRGQVKEFSVDHPNDNFTAVGGSYDHIFTYDTTLITSLYLTTSRGFTSPLFGEMKGTEFEFKGENGGKLIGFHGRAGHAIDAIGAYFDTGSKPGGDSNSGKGTDSGSSTKDSGKGTDSGSSTKDSGKGSDSGSSTQDSGKGSDSGSSTQRLEAQGGKGGNQWDDGGDYDGVTKIHVAVGRWIEEISFEYVKNGQTKKGPARGVRGRRSTIGTFEISHPNEYLISVKGWSDSSNKIAGIQFKTNTKTSKYYGFEKIPGDESTDILLEVKDKKIVGFHGFADSHVNALGAYIAPAAN
ncbi:jacalin-related lectin 34 isoform X1 [Brassica rapa]|uniref:jacalin-related lectin 34 isoform X1 n=1 Tax=Brassica campestris TaxID=3711 RepID=UPI00142DD1C7|nr:jacalin-related lectin 34 isoform X1 [Brassica rapa]